MSQGWQVIAGMVTSVAISVSAALFARRKNNADVSKTDAEAADLLSQGAVRLVPYYESRLAAQQSDINELKHRVQRAEAAEARCLLRVEALQVQIDELRNAIAVPLSTVTTTTVEVVK